MTVGISVPINIGNMICDDLATKGIWPDINNAEDVLFGTANNMEIEVEEEHKDLLLSLKKAYCG